jgi:nitrous oxidase accessory protein NosD
MSRSRSTPTGRIVLAAALTAAVCAGASSAARSAPAASLCVGAKPGCFSTVQAAVDSARDGDTIQIRPGMFQGGITIDKSVRLVGVSAATTTITGGGPVVTVGRFDGNNEDLTVGLSRLTITGGLNDSQPSTAVVAGGGIWIPGSSRKRKRDIVISQNRLPGRVLPAGSKIDLIVSRGRKR